MLRKMTMIAATLLLGSGVAAAQPAPRAYVVGDSLSDTGTFALVTSTGRFTTTPGRLWTEVVADSIGASVAPANLFDGSSFAATEGTNFAQSGSLVTGEQGLYDGASKSIRWQIDELLRRSGGRAETGALYLVAGGGPDVVAAGMQAVQATLTPDAAVAQVQTAARELARQAKRLQESGANRIVLANVANFGATPVFGAGRGTAATLATKLSQAFNTALDAEVKKIGLRVTALDLYAFFDKIIAEPNRYGLVNVTEPAVDTVKAKATPTGNSANSNAAHLVKADAARTYLFADPLHPTGRGHELLGAYAVTLIQSC
jgi:outer membrane lipase/esterase